MTIPGTWNPTIYQGAKWVKTITYPDRDMTGGSFRMHIRTGKDSDSALLELTTANGRISASLSGTDTVITLTIDATDTAALNFESVVYDLEYVPASGEADVERILQGKIYLDEEVTK